MRYYYLTPCGRDRETQKQRDMDLEGDRETRQQRERRIERQREAERQRVKQNEFIFLKKISGGL